MRLSKTEVSALKKIRQGIFDYEEARLIDNNKGREEAVTAMSEAVKVLEADQAGRATKNGRV